MSFASCPEDSETFHVSLESDPEEEEEVLSPPLLQLATAQQLQQETAERASTFRHIAGVAQRVQRVVAGVKAAAAKMGRGKSRQRNATITTPQSSRPLRSCRKAAVDPAQRPDSTRGKENAADAAAVAGLQSAGGSRKGRKRAAADSHDASQKEHAVRQIRAAAKRTEVTVLQQRQEQERAIAERPPAKRARKTAKPLPAQASAAAGSEQKLKTKEQQTQQEEARPETAGQPGAVALEPSKEDVQPQGHQRCEEERRFTTVGPQPSQSLHDSILKSPSPPRRGKSIVSVGVAPLGALLAAAGGANAVQPPPAAAAAEQGAVDQPPPPQQQQQQPHEAPPAHMLAAAEPAAAAAAVQPEAAAGDNALLAAERPAGQAQEAAELEATGSSPVVTRPAKRQRSSPAEQQQHGVLRPVPVASGDGSPRRQSPRLKGSPDASCATTAANRSPPVPSAAPTPAARGGDAAGASAAGAQPAETWWDPLDPEKVRAVKAALHIGGYTRGSLPLCRERQAAAVGSWLHQQMAAKQGGSIYLSGPPGTGKSLTAHEVVRQCWRPPAPQQGTAATVSGGEGVAAALACLPPPALLSINCMSITDPQQVVERILLGYTQACAAPNPDAALAAGNDPIVYPTAEGSAAAHEGAAASARARRRSGGDALQQLRRLVLSPVACKGPASGSDAGKAAAKGGSARKGRGSKRRASGAVEGGAAGGGGARGMVVVILDELDSLLSGSKGEELVESLFCLAAAPASRLLLLGIANSIDLVQQLMKPGGALHRRNLRPAHELFPAYVRLQFSQVLHQRLASLPGRVFDPNAIELCCRKMANGNGDMRRALEACAQALDTAVKEAAAESQQAPAAAEAAGPSSSGAARRVVGMRAMASALSRITGGIGLGNDMVRAIRALPPQQMLLVCTVGKLLGDSLGSRGLPVRNPTPMATPGSSRKAPAASRARAAFMSPTNSASSRKSGGSMLSGGSSVISGVARSREVLVGQLEEAFTHLCKQVGMEPYNSREFATACESLQDLGLIGLAAAREAKWRRVTLRVPDDDIALALADVPVLKNVVGT